MQFVQDGPDIPERLLQAHEEGRVVFFCGAGISRPAQLPNFAGLVKKLYAKFGEPNAVQQAAIKAKQFDTAIGLLEQDIVGGRKEGLVRKALAEVLKPNLAAPNATETHKALLTLSKSRKGRMRLITTNFDRLFEDVIASQSMSITRFDAPLLPVPKSRWDGLVYLHGLLADSPTPSDLDRLVISSGDFGLAYLTERWAARFVSELFRKYTVCFVGYSINDPVMRYMMDALAADRLLGEQTPDMFAFGSYSKGKQKERADEWCAKNVIPILYREHKHHAYLHKSLWAWAETYRDGVRGKESIVVESAMALPLGGTKQDYFIPRMLWALSDKEGLPAKRFAEMNPVPSLKWLEALSEERYGHADLDRFGVPPKDSEDEKLAFSLTSRPSPYPLAPRMCVVDAGARRSDWDKVMGHLANWLTRHLDDAALLWWLAKPGGQLHQNFAQLIERRLDHLARLERDGDEAQLKRIRENAPNAIPGPFMRTLWRLLLTGRVKSWGRDLDLYRWRDRFNRDGLTATLRLDLREILTPRVYLREPFGWPSEEKNAGEPQRPRALIDWQVVLSTEHVHSGLQDQRRDERWTTALPELQQDFTTLLRDALDLMRELGGAQDRSDSSYIHQPSIGEHAQNHGFHPWTALIELTRDAWLATAAISPERAMLAVESWWLTPYPLFKRLVFFAAGEGELVPVRRALDWLLADEHWWLWSVETQREAMRLLVALAPQLDDAMARELEKAILAGPPRTLFKDDIEPERWSGIVDREIWLRLAKIAEAGAVLSPASQDRLNELAAKHPEWQLAADQREEFPCWMESGGWVGDRDPWRISITIPRSRRGVLDYLVANPVLSETRQDDWRQLCSETFQATAYALCRLAKMDVWPNERWRDALQAWSDERLQIRSWQYMGPVLATAPNRLLQSITRDASRWLQTIAKVFEHHEAKFFDLSRRIFALDYESGDDDDPVGQAINHPVGHVTEALLRWWYRRTLEDEQGLPVEIKTSFTELCDTRVEKFRHGRVLLAVHVITLFRVDAEWAAEYLLPLFDWRRSESEAQAAWEGFLWSPRLYRPMMALIKHAFLDTARHYAALGKHDRQYAALLTFAALDPGDVFTKPELATATRALPPEGLQETAQTLARAQKGAGPQRAEYWSNKVLPYLRSIWPQTREHVTPAIAEPLGLLCVAAGDAFPEALTQLRAWLQALEYPDYVVEHLHDEELCGRFPEEALAFLSQVIGDQTRMPPRKLQPCLKAVLTAAPHLEADPRFQDLAAYLRLR
jgi:hypothetical protein